MSNRPTRSRGLLQTRGWRELLVYAHIAHNADAQLVDARR